MAADLLARLTDQPDMVAPLCAQPKGQALIRTCLHMGARGSLKHEVRADLFVVLRNILQQEEGQELLAKENSLRQILEGPPWHPSRKTHQQGDEAAGIEGGEGSNAASSAIDDRGLSGSAAGEQSADGVEVDGEGLLNVVWQSWLRLALVAVQVTGGSILDGAPSQAGLHEVVFDMWDGNQDSSSRVACLLLLTHLYDRRCQLPGLCIAEAERLAAMVRWGLEFGQGCGPTSSPTTAAAAAPASPGSEPDDSVNLCREEALNHTMSLVAVVGSLPHFRAALLQMDMSKLEIDMLQMTSSQAAFSTIGNLFGAVLKTGGRMWNAWKALSVVTEAKYVRRLMRAHTDVNKMLQCLLSALGSDDAELTEHLVCFLKQIFTGATDQFLSTDSNMFDNLGGARGLTKLMSELLASMEDASLAHRANIVAFLADSMFFSRFTDTWQAHPQANNLINHLFDALLLRGTEGTAGLALGNFVSANGHIDLILDHPRVVHSLSNVAFFLKRTQPGWDTKMQIYYLWRVLRSRKGCKLLRKHPHADHIILGLLKGIRHASMEDNEVLSLLECFLNDDETRSVVLRGSNTSAILDGVFEILGTNRRGEAELCELAIELLQALLDAVGHGALLAWRGSPDLITLLGKQGRKGKEVLDGLVPYIQWEPSLVARLSLGFKRAYVSEQISDSPCRGRDLTDAPILTVSRKDILRSLLDGMAHDPKVLKHGVQVSFHSEGETGSGDGHRREFFRLAASKLMDPAFGLFKSSDGGRTLHPSSTATDAEPDALTYFTATGKLIALALLHRETLPTARFTLALRKMILASEPLQVEDMKSVDPEFYTRKICYLRDSAYAAGPNPLTLAALDETFEDVPQPDVFPDVRHELCPGGASMPVTEENKEHYLELLCDFRMRGSVSAYVKALVFGMKLIMEEEAGGGGAFANIQRILSPEDFDLLLCGPHEIDVEEWRESSRLGEGLDQQTWEMFWSAVSGMPPEKHRELLEFTTGSPGPPVDGFAALPGYGAIGHVQPFTVAPPRNPRNSMPTAATCFNTLHLPKYNSSAEMSAALLEAIAHRDVGGFYEASVAQRASNVE